MVDNSPSIVIIIIISVCQDYNNIKCIIKPRYIENSFFQPLYIIMYLVNINLYCDIIRNYAFRNARGRFSRTNLIGWRDFT